MAQTTIVTTLENGINRDVPPRFQPKGTYRHARNKKRSTEKFFVSGLTNELQSLYAAVIPGKIVGYHRLEERNSTLFFHVDGGSCFSIFNHDTDEVKFVARDKEFGCDWGFKECKWIGYGHSDSKTLAPCNDLIIYWASDHTYYLANIDELLDSKRRESIKKLKEPCDHFRHFPKIPGPRVRLHPNRGGGKDLVPGQYYGAARLGDESGNFSNWGPIEGPAYIGSKYNKFTDYSHQSIQFQAKFLSDKYSRVQIAVIPPVGSVSQDVAYLIYDGSYNTNGVSVEYYSPSQHKENIPIGQIITKDIKWLRGDNLIADDGKLHMYKTLQEFNPKVQQWAEQIRIYAVAFAVPASQAHKVKSFRPDEVYPFGIEYVYTDQTVTAVGHIPGERGTRNDLTCGQCELPLGHTANDAERLETYYDITGDQNTICGTGGQQTTLHEGADPTKIVDCAPETPITPRSEEGNDCVEHTEEKQAVETKIEEYQSQPENAADCLDCAKDTTLNDLKKTDGILVNHEEQVTDLLRTDKEVGEDCTTGKSDNLEDSGKILYDEGVANAEQDEELTLRTVVVKSGGTNLTLTRSEQEMMVLTTKGEDCITDELDLIPLYKYRMAGWNSSLPYPETLDCDGKPLYGRHGEPLNFHKFPDRSKVAPFISSQRGVESRFDPSNIPGSKDTYVVVWGIQVENVYLPSYEKGEIPKPLDENNPWRIVVGKRERHNQSVIYSCYLTNTFLGKIGGSEYAVPRHAANAYPNVDRSILTETGSHIGEDWTRNIYLAHSPDMGTATDFINGDYIKVEGRVTGDGQVYGLTAEGKPVKEDEHRLDRLGARSAMNFATWESLDFQTCLKGAEFVEFNTNLQNPQGISRPILNKYRESSIAIETKDALPVVGTAGKDKSFNTGGLDHEYFTKGQVLLVTIKRFNSQQYGAIESLQYVDIGVVGRKGETNVRAATGDAFVQKWSHKRTSHISDKVGNKLNVDYPVTADPEFLGPDSAHDGLDRGVCDPPNRRGYRMREFLGFWNRLELPKNGDKRDPKNMANGHPTKSAFEIWGDLTSPGTDVEVETDLYYFRTLAHLNHFPGIDTDTNLHYRSTSPPATREIFYEERQGIDVDSSINQANPEDAWLNDWHYEQKQPTKNQMIRKAKIRFALVFGGPAIIAALMSRISTALQGNTTSTVTPFFGSLWLVMVYNILSGKKLDRFLGIPECKEDNEGAQGEDKTRGLKDNWMAYNYGFSEVNSWNTFIGMPVNYNTCRCDNKYTNLIYSSNHQMDTSSYDAWRNFQALSYTGIAGDSGQLEKLYVWANGIYAQTTDGMFKLQHKNASISSSGGELLLGTNGFIANPPKILEGTFEGFGGTSNPNASATCKLGYISTDPEAKEITIFNGSFSSVVGKNCGLYKYWKKNYTFCNSGTQDEMCSDGIHYTFGYDPEYELLMITKHDGDKGFTWSYDPAAGKYISQHDYVPDFYFWDRNKLFYVEDSKIYRLNMPGAYSTYGGKKYPSSVDLVATRGGLVFSYVNSLLDTEVAYKGLEDRNETYDRAWIYNGFQQTGWLPIEPENNRDALSKTKDKTQLTISRRESGTWKFNDVLSRELNRDIPVVIEGKCGEMDQPNLANIDPKPKDQKAKTFKGKYLQHRFEFNKNDRQIIFYGLTTSVDVPLEQMPSEE